MINNKMIGNRIAEARKKINISQAQLAERLFISSQAVGKWERGESMPDITTFNRLAEILGVDLNYFSENFPSAVPESDSPRIPSGKLQQKLKWDMSLGNWLDADFSGLKGLHEKFSSSNMQRCKFIGSELSGLLLSNNHVDSCDFSGSDISGSHIKGSYFTNNQFNNCVLKATEFSGSYITGGDFTSTDFTGVKIKAGGIEQSTMTNAIWHHTSFIGNHLIDLTFNGTMEDCYFENCKFTRVTFQDVTLLNTFFKNNRNLKQIKFIDCQADRMTYEFLKSGKADLTGIKLLNT